MGILVYRDRNGHPEFVGRIDYRRGERGTFSYDEAYVRRAVQAEELGISVMLPLDAAPYSSAEFGPFFEGLLPEGEVLANLASLYQVPRSDYLALLEQMGCESIGALTFVSEGVDPREYEPRYEQVESKTLNEMIENPVRMATLAASSTRLSLAGAQYKVAWFLSKDADARSASAKDWMIPRGTAPSTHIIKISRRGEEEIALNELACALLARACGFEVAEVHELAEVPGAISVARYDRVRVEVDGADAVVRLHQEDFCQALGLAPFFKYQPQGVEANYPYMAADLIESASANPQDDLLEFSKRMVFNYVIGNSDAHFKNFSLLYNRAWTARRLAPLYDVTCIPLTGYSTAMPFDIGDHRALEDIDERDFTLLAADMDVSLGRFSEEVSRLVTTLEAPSLEYLDSRVENMVGRILENSAPRLKVVRDFLGRAG